MRTSTHKILILAIAALCAAAMLTLVTGCASNTGANPAGGPPAKQAPPVIDRSGPLGSAVFNVVWPTGEAGARVIPPETQSILVKVYEMDVEIASGVIPLGETQLVLPGLPPGDAAVKAWAMDGPDATGGVVARGEATTTIVAEAANTVDITLEALGTGDVQVTVTLTWGELPTDLDSHLVTPATAGFPDGFHVCYYNMGDLSVDPWVNLDTDDVTSWGPEVVTIAQPQEGTYSYLVHNYSGQYGGPIEESAAIVTLGLPDGTTQTYNVPTDNPDNLDMWYVFDLVFAAGVPTVTDVNTWHDRYGEFDTMFPGVYPDGTW